MLLGAYIKPINTIGIYGPINELISFGDITYNDNIITISEGAFADELTEGFYCLFNANFPDDGPPTSVNLVPSSYIVQETVINENPYYFETEGEHEVEFEYVNKFYPDLIYPRTYDHFSQSCIIELNDNFYDYCYTNIDEDKIEKVSLSNNVPESVVDSIISATFYKFKEINVNTDKYITVNNCVIDRNTFELVTLGGGDITVPSFVKSYGHMSTAYNKELTSIKFLNNYNVTECPSFNGCENLKYVTLPNSMKIDLVNNDANKFDDCPNIEEFNGKYASDDKKFLIIDNVIISAAGDEHINIPNTVNRIGVASFRRRTNLKSITIPDSVTSVGDWAFSNCTALTAINIPSEESIYKIDYGIYNLTDSYKNNVNFYVNDNLINVYKDDVIIPDSVTSIGKGVFYNNKNLTSINIPDSVTSIGDYAFSGCSNLAEIICHDMTAPTIEANTFYNIKTGGVLKVPTDATGYDTWMSTSNHYLGKYGWTIEYI